MYVVIVGKMFGTKTVHGPFSTSAEADSWALDNAQGQHSEVVPLEGIAAPPAKPRAGPTEVQWLHED